MATINAIGSNIPIEASLGGTGAITETSHGVLIGGGTGAVTATAEPSNGQTIIAATSAAPTAATITSSDGTVVFTTGSGSLSLSTVNYVASTAWTLTLRFGGSASGIAFSSNASQYTRIGNVVFLQFRFGLTSKGSATGAMTMTGIPLAAATGTWPLTIRYINLTPNLQLTMSLSGSTITAYNNASAGAQTALADTDFSNNTSLSGSCIYFI